MIAESRALVVREVSKTCCTNKPSLLKLSIAPQKLYEEKQNTCIFNNTIPINIFVSFRRGTRTTFGWGFFYRSLALSLSRSLALALANHNNVDV